MFAGFYYTQILQCKYFLPQNFAYILYRESNVNIFYFSHQNAPDQQGKLAVLRAF